MMDKMGNWLGLWTKKRSVSEPDEIATGATRSDRS